MHSNFLKHLKFLLTSTNQHGVHSPFVFSYLTQCLDAKKIYAHSKTIDLLLKSISYFECKNLRIEGNPEIRAIVSQKFPSMQFEDIPFDIVYGDMLHPQVFSDVLSDKKNIHNNSMILLDSIYRNKDSERLWTEIKADESVTVTLDLFYCGLVFFRKEQAKEHFKIRI